MIEEERKRKNESEYKDESPTRRGRIIVMQATLLNHSVERSPPMPLTVDNKLPGCLLRFGKTAEDEVSFICHVDTCAAMSTGNLGLHQWLITKYPAIVAEYTQYDDASPFEPIRLAVALKDLDGCEITKNKLTAVVRYWTPYLDTDGNRLVISFGLGESIAVNSIVGLPFLSHWKASICFHSNSLTSALLKMKFPLIYEVKRLGFRKELSSQRRISFDQLTPNQPAYMSQTLGTIDQSASQIVVDMNQMSLLKVQRILVECSSEQTLESQGGSRSRSHYFIEIKTRPS